MGHDLQVIRKKMVKHAKECIKHDASNSEIYGKMEAVFMEMETAPTVIALSLSLSLSLCATHSLNSDKHIVNFLADQRVGKLEGGCNES